jgi:hypothetical protein
VVLLGTSRRKCRPGFAVQLPAALGIVDEHLVPVGCVDPLARRGRAA